MTKIWCLFSIANNYDQPQNNLERWWSQKPSIEQLGKYMACPLDTADDEDVVKVVNLWQGQTVRFSHNDTDYRLEVVPEGESL